MKKYPYIDCTEDLWKEIKPELIKLGCKFSDCWGEYSPNCPFLVSNFGHSNRDELIIGFVCVKPENCGLRYLVSNRDSFINGIKDLIYEDFKYPCIKIRSRAEFSRIIKKLKKLGFLYSMAIRSGCSEYITINITKSKGYFSLVSKSFCLESRRELITDEKEFLDTVEEILMNSNVDLLKSNISVGCVIVVGVGRIFIVIPFENELGVIEYLGESDVMTLDKFYKNYKNDITELHDKPKTLDLISGEILWGKN